MKSLKFEIDEKFDVYSDFFIREHTSTLKNELHRVINFLLNSSNYTFYVNLRRKETVSEEWNTILNLPQFFDCLTLENVANRISILGNGEAGCEQGISEYNRTKNKFSSVMNVDTIEARMRISLNGAPIHIFESDAIVKYLMVVDMQKKRRRKQIKSQK